MIDDSMKVGDKCWAGQAVGDWYDCRQITIIQDLSAEWWRLATGHGLRKTQAFTTRAACLRDLIARTRTEQDALKTRIEGLERDLAEEP